MNKILLSVLKVLVVAGAIFCTLRYLAEFSGRQSVVVTVVATLFYLMRLPLGGEKPVFVPYGMFVKPNLGTILTDLELVKDTKEDWARVRAGIEKLPKEQWNIWNNGFSISFITPELIYDKAANGFVTEVNLYASLDPIVILRDGQKLEDNPIISPFSPALLVERGYGGYRLRIVLLDWYWEKVKNKEALKSLDADGDPMRGTVDVLLTIIPDEEFGVHFGVGPGDSGEAYKAAVHRRREVRSRYGWTGKSRNDEYGNETDADRSNTIEHRYFSVSHWDL
jgi:hypothetical protein